MRHYRIRLLPPKIDGDVARLFGNSLIGRPMLRGPRLDVADVLYHVIGRGVERRPIFRTEPDRGQNDDGTTGTFL
jgi:hypothetical protein